MRKIYINDELKRLSKEYAENLFSERMERFVLPLTGLNSLKDELIEKAFPDHADYVSEIIDRYPLLNCLLPSEFDLVKNEFDDILEEGRLNDEMRLMNNNVNKKFYKYIVEAMRYDALRDKEFLPYLRNLGMKTCIYCNSQLAIVIEESDDKYIAKLELDHFKPKSLYPFLCTSFFNLYPTCSYCNKAKSKNPAEFQLYVEESDQELDDFIFKLKDESVINYWNYKNPEVLEISFDTKVPNSALLDNHEELFCISGIYNTQKDLIEELLYKKEVYTEVYKKDLADNFEKLFPDQALLKRLIIGNYDKPEEIYKRPMSKFVQDIARQIGLID